MNLPIFTLPSGEWSNNVTMHEKSVVVFFASFFRNRSKKAETILIIKKNEQKTMAFWST